MIYVLVEKASSKRCSNNPLLMMILFVCLLFGWWVMTMIETKSPGLNTTYSLSLLLFSIILIWNEVIRIWFTCLIGIFNILWQKLLQVICQFNEIWTWFVLGAKTIYAKIVTCLFHFNSYCIVGLFYTGGNEFIPLPIVSFISL